MPVERDTRAGQPFQYAHRHRDDLTLWYAVQVHALIWHSLVWHAFVGYTRIRHSLV